MTGMGHCHRVAGSQVKEEGQFNSYLTYPMVHEVRISLKAGMTHTYFKSHGTDLHHPFPKNGLRLPQLWEGKEHRSWESGTPRNHKLSMTSHIIKTNKQT